MLVKVSKYIVSGGAAAVAEYASFVLLNMVFSVLTANPFSFLIGLVVSFLLNRRWVFGSAAGIRGQFLKYVMVAAVNLVVSTVVMWLLVETLGVHPLLSKVLVMAMIASWNFVIFSRLIFNNSPAIIKHDD